MLCPLPQTALTSLSVSPSGALPGDALNSVVDTSFSQAISFSIKDQSAGSVSYLQVLNDSHSSVRRLTIVSFEKVTLCNFLVFVRSRIMV